MTITLIPGEAVNIRFKDTPGGFYVVFDETHILVQEITGCPDDQMRKGVIYELTLADI